MINALISGQEQYSTIFTTTSMVEWQKPSYCSMVYILAVGGGGGGGGGGATNASITIGGSGGAGGGTFRAFFPASSLPDVLYIQPGAGGAGGTGHINNAGGTNGSAGGTTFIYAGLTGTNVYLCRAEGGNGGNVASTTGGTAPATVTTNTPFFRVGCFETYTSIAGTAGGNGNSSGTNATQSSSTSFLNYGGTGGGGASTGSTVYQGGTFSIGSPYPSYLSETAVAGGAGLNGQEFYNKPYFYIITGGKGGMSSRTTGVSGGRGGNGLLGSGGGGGGAFRGDTTTQGGAGGTGGNGWVLIIAR
jgi:hypothetical protein